MKLLTEQIKRILPALYSTENTPCDEKKIICRFFNPLGNQWWKIVEGSQEGEDWTLFGLVDLGFGCAEWGYISLNELEALDVGLGLGIERDILFETRSEREA
jgi:hypothetical protein